MTSKSTTRKPPTKASRQTAIKGKTAAPKNSKPATSPAKPASRPKRRAAERPALAAQTPTPLNKQAALIALLRGQSGATVEQMIQLTGWQAHTIRGTISGVLRKRLGLNVLCAAADEGGGRVYRIIASAAPVAAS